MRRSKQRLAEIDSVLNEHYYDKGAVWCAGRLNEPYDYIRSRVQLKGLKMNSQARSKQRSLTSSTMPKKEYKTQAKTDSEWRSKYYSALGAVKRLKNELESSNEVNKSLRLEIIKLQSKLRRKK